MPIPLHLAVALDGAGWHPAAWREPSARPDELFTAGYWLDLAKEAEAGFLDFLTIEDSFGLRSAPLAWPGDAGTEQVQGHLDAVLIAARIAPLTEHIGLIPTAVVTHTEPFHVSKAIATLDYVSTGRAGVRVRISVSPEENANFGRREIPPLTRADLATAEGMQLISDLFAEATDYVEVIRRLWDSWEDEAEIRDAATGRFIDRDKIHYIDFQSDHLAVKGPSIVPRPPQGQPLVTILAHSTPVYRLAAVSADIVFITPTDVADAERIVQEVRHEVIAAGRPIDGVQIFADLVVFLDSATESGQERKARLDQVAGTDYSSDALVFSGDASELADLLAQWQHAGITGFRLRPGALPDDLATISRELVPELQSRGLFRDAYEASTLRGLFGLARPVNRYATIEEGVSA